MAPPINSEQTAQQPVTEEAISEDPSLPQQGSSQTTVPEQVVKGPTEPGMSALSTRPAKDNTSVSRVTEQTEEQQPEVRAQPTFTDAEARGKALVITEASDARQTSIETRRRARRGRCGGGPRPSTGQATTCVCVTLAK